MVNVSSTPRSVNSSADAEDLSPFIDYTNKQYTKVIYDWNNEETIS